MLQNFAFGGEVFCKFLEFAVASSRNTGGGVRILLEVEEFPQHLSGN